MSSFLYETDSEGELKFGIVCHQRGLFPRTFFKKESLFSKSSKRKSLDKPLNKKDFSILTRTYVRIIIRVMKGGAYGNH